MATYVLNFQGLADYAQHFASGLALTAELAVAATAGGIALGIIGGIVRNGRKNLLYKIWTAYVELFRNTPFLVQLFFIFFGLPELCIHLAAEPAALLALIVNLGAYITEIVRAAIAVTPKGQWEAARVLGLSKWQAYRKVVLPPAIRKVYPAIVGQCVLVMLGSAVISQISCEDLTYAASYTQSITFLSFESYMAATVLYLLLAVIMRHTMLGLGKFIFRGN